MVSEVARIHLKPANALGFARALAGWAVALGGFVLLVSEFLEHSVTLTTPLRQALLGGAMSATATALGALPVLFMRHIHARIQDMLLGFGAGVMLAASVFSLLLPAFDVAQASGLTQQAATALAALALSAGALLLLALDRSLPHTHHPEGSRAATAVWLFVFAIAVHNIPEGLAIGVAAGEAGTGNAVATGISLQNVPEGLIIALALLSAGYQRGFAVGVAVLSGLVEPLAALVGASMVAASAALLPWGLAGAAGAMLFVVSHEIIPESHRRGHETLATFGLIVGFVVMMMLDTWLA